MRRQEAQPVPRHPAQFHRRGEAAQQRGHRWRRHIGEVEGLLGLRNQQQPRSGNGRTVAFQAGRQIPAILAEQSHRYRNDQGLLVRLTRRKRGMLAQGQRVAPGSRVVGIGNRHLRRAGLMVPALETGQINPGRVLHRLGEIVDRHRLIIVAFEIQIHAAAERLAADQRVHHADDFRAFLVDRRGVEIIDRDVLVRLHRMRQRPAILAELRGTQPAHIADPLDHARPLIGGKLLVAKNRQSFFQRQLKPVAAGNPVAGPVVEILMRDDGFDVLVIGVGRRCRLGQHVFGVEDIQPLVLHRPHVEVRHGGDVEHVQIVFQAEYLLVPGHRLLQRCHRVPAGALVPRPHPDAKLHLAAGARGEMVRKRHQIPRHQREQITGLRVRILPAGEMPPARLVALRDLVAVRQQHRHQRLVGVDRHAVARHHIRTVGEVGDAPEPLGLALGEEAALGHIQAAEFGVGRRVHARFDLQRAAVGQAGDDQAAAVQLILVGAEFLAVQHDTNQGQAVAIQMQRRRRLAVSWIAP